MVLGITLPARCIVKIWMIVMAVLFAAPARAQGNWAQISFNPELIKTAAVPAPSVPLADYCAALPQALAASISSAYDAHTVACFESLLAVADYVSPPQAGTAPSGQLSGKEQAALDSYVDVYAYLVNSALRQGEDVSKYRKYIRTLNAALGKLPVYSGVTFRGSSYPPVAEGKLAPGAVFTDPAFLSTSRNLAVAEGYTGAAGYLSVVLSKTGRQVSYNSSTDDLQSEMEVLFSTDTRFRVIAVVDRPQGYKAVYLEELP